MQVNTRAIQLQEAIEATGRTVKVHSTPWAIRISFEQPAPTDPWWPDLLRALRKADRWGHVRLDGGDTVFAEIAEGTGE